MNDHMQQFRQALAGRNIIPPTEILDDGRLHRCDAEGKGGKGDAAYLLHSDGIPAGGFENHRDGLGWQSWRADIGRNLTPTEEAAYRAKIEAARRVREAEEAERKAKAREKACMLWAEAYPCMDHPYLTKKGISANGVKVHRDRLVLPMRDAKEQKIHSLQFIGADGEKRYLTGGRKEAGYFGIGKPEGVLCIAEGFATGASIHEATGYAVAVAFDCGNLFPVAKALRVRFPDIRLVLCADDDYQTTGNPGLTKAWEAALAVGGAVAVPVFDQDRPDNAKDFNDMAALYGKDAVKRAIENATAPAGREHQPGDDDAPAGEYERGVNLVCAANITPEPIGWLWNGWLAAGKLHIFGGAPGTGKTTISMGLAATVTTGGRWPDGSRSHAGNVVIWSGEDDPGDTLIPRLLLSGADLSRTYFVTGIREGNERRSFDPARDMELLKRKMLEISNVRLLIVDPIVSAIVGDSHKNAEVRRGLQPLVDLAASMNCALLGITHFSKGTTGRDPVERLTGSLAFGALARVVLVAAKHQEEGEDGRTVRLFCRAKSNISPDDGGFEYDLNQSELREYPGIFASSVLWGNPVEGAARELLANADATGDDGEGGTLADAKRFLTDLLSDGAMKAGEVFKEADNAGYSKRSIQRAANAIKVERRKDGMRGGWTWRLAPKMPDMPEDAVDARLKSLAPSAPSLAPSFIEVEI